MVMVGWPNDKNNNVRVNDFILNGAIDVIDHALGWMEGVKDVKGKLIHFELHRQLFASMPSRCHNYFVLL